MTDWKGEPRIADPAAVRAARVREDACAACGRTPGSAHHLIPKGRGQVGDDVPGNLVMVCGHGTAGCHGAIHGSAYTDAAGKRWTQQSAAAAVGRYLMTKRPDAVTYVLTKLGDAPGREYLRRRYHLVLPADYATAGA